MPPASTKLTGDLIDVLQVESKTYRVLAFYTLSGRYHTRYAFVHFSDDGKLTDYIQCESDDADQYFFQKKHPKEAAEGGRSFSPRQVFRLCERHVTGFDQVLLGWRAGLRDGTCRRA